MILANIQYMQTMPLKEAYAENSLESNLNSDSIDELQKNTDLPLLLAATIIQQLIMFY